MNTENFNQLAQNFFQKLELQMTSQGILLKPEWQVDHICYRTESEHNYTKLKGTFNKLGVSLCESMVGGRLISVFKLTEPVIFRKQSIDILELPAPKSTSPRTEGFEHIEVVVKESFSQIREFYPNCHFNQKRLNKKINPELCLKLEDYSIKFHHQTLESVVEYEQSL